jgi:hypothetical protein
MMLIVSAGYGRPSFITYRLTHLVLYHWGNIEMSIHDAWEDLPLGVTGYCSDDADVEAEGGKVSNESL